MSVCLSGLPVCGIAKKSSPILKNNLKWSLSTLFFCSPCLAWLFVWCVSLYDTSVCPVCPMGIHCPLINCLFIRLFTQFVWLSLCPNPWSRKINFLIVCLSCLFVQNVCVDGKYVSIRELFICPAILGARTASWPVCFFGFVMKILVYFLACQVCTFISFAYLSAWTWPF